MECIALRSPARLGIFGLLGLLGLLALGSLAWAVAPALATSDDLMRRAEEVALFVRGLDPYQDPDMTYPPSAPPFFTPLIAPFEPETVRAVWLGLNLITLAVVAVVILRIWGREWPAWLQTATVLALIATKPVRGGIALGQFHLIPLTLGLLAVLATRARRPTLAGWLLGIALIKPTMVLPLAGWLLVRRQWRALATAGLVQAGSWLFTSAWLGIAPWTLAFEWLSLAKGQEAAGLIDLPSLMRRAWPGGAAWATPLALTLLGVGLVAMERWRRRSDQALVAFACFLAAIFTYHRPYDLVLLLPTLAYFVDRAWSEPTRGPAAWIVAIVLAVGLIWPSHPSVTGRFESLYEPIFVPLAYATLVLLVRDLLRGEAILTRSNFTPVPGCSERIGTDDLTAVPRG